MKGSFAATRRRPASGLRLSPAAHDQEPRTARQRHEIHRNHLPGGILRSRTAVRLTTQFAMAARAFGHSRSRAGGAICVIPPLLQSVQRVGGAAIWSRQASSLL